MRRMPLLQLVTAILALRRAAAVQKQKQLLSPLFDERLAGARRNKGSRLSAAPSLSGFRPSSTKSPIANMQEVFELADADRNGQVSLHELDRLLGPQPTASNVTLLM